MANPEKRTSEGHWKPGVSGNPKGRPKKKHALTVDLLEASEETFTYYENGKRKTAAKGAFISNLILDALTTGFFTFPALDEEGSPRRVEVGSSDLMRLITFYFTRIEGTPTKKQDEPDEEQEQLTMIEAEELDKLRQQRWAAAQEQILEAVDFDEKPNTPAE